MCSSHDMLAASPEAQRMGSLDHGPEYVNPWAKIIFSLYKLIAYDISLQWQEAD
jgi:hypothetical protein